MKYVYLLQSINDPSKRYVGLTDNLQKRLDEHNAGKSAHTSRHALWEITVAIQFRDEQRAFDFEKYIKSGSGHAFAKRHFWPSL